MEHGVYGLEVSLLNIADLLPFDFIVSRFFMMLFNTNVMYTILDYFDFDRHY